MNGEMEKALPGFPFEFPDEQLLDFVKKPMGIKCTRLR